MKGIKKLLFKLLSQRAYVRWMHRGFFLLYRLGSLKNKQAFKYHYLVRELIQEDFTVVDIGANLGYFSKTFARLASKGHVVSIEPVPLFYQTLKHFIGNYPNVTIHNVALGTEPGTVEMALPETDGMMRTGLPHIASSREGSSNHKTIPVQLVKGSELIGALPKIDYIKCDIEGFEWVVFQEIREVIAAKRPIIQLEIAAENEAHFFAYFNELGYTQYGVANFKVVQESGTQQEQGDFLFVPNEKIAVFNQKHNVD